MKKQLLNLFTLVEKWGQERNFYGIDGTTAVKQFTKLVEEQGELAGNIARGKDYTDDIGDYQVVLGHIARISGVKIDDSVLSDIDVKPVFYKGICKESALIDLTKVTGKIGSAILSGDNNKLKILIKKAFFRLHALSMIAETNLVHCLEHSYNEIKDRKGSMVNGVYVKESDIQKVYKKSTCPECLESVHEMELEKFSGICEECSAPEEL